LSDPGQLPSDASPFPWSLTRLSRASGPDVLRVTAHFDLRAIPTTFRAFASVRPPGGMFLFQRTLPAANRLRGVESREAHGPSVNPARAAGSFPRRPPPTSRIGPERPATQPAGSDPRAVRVPACPRPFARQPRLPRISSLQPPAQPAGPSAPDERPHIERTALPSPSEADPDPGPLLHD
jgi:hypothetical protein